MTSTASRSKSDVDTAAKFLAAAGVCLRYQPSPSVPLASMYGFADERHATILTNALIDRGDAVEINCIADRVCLAHKTLVPSLIALARRNELSDDAERVLGVLIETPRPTAGMVRKFMGVPPQKWPNAADEALAELQRAMVIDRGSTDVPETGAVYLSKDGIPYRIVDDVHAKHVKASAKLSIETALQNVLLAIVDDIAITKLRSLCKRIATAAEVDAAVDALVAKRKLLRDGKAVSRPRPSRPSRAGSTSR
jgi:hypothetical protein